jgi:uncharacterized membrane protein required for colicin V production
MTSLDRSHPEAQPPGRVIVLFSALTVAAVALTLVAAYWRHDGADALGYLGGGMFGAALTFLLLTSAQWSGRSRRHR